MSRDSIDTVVARIYNDCHPFFEERERLDLHVDYMDVVDKTIRIGWIHGKSDEDIFSDIETITCQNIDPCLAGVDPTQIGEINHAVRSK